MFNIHHQCMVNVAIYRCWALVEYILFCNLLWWIFYYFLLLVTKQSQEWCCRVLTFFHGCLISYSAVKDIIVNKSPVDFKSIPLSDDKKNYLSYMLSYFLFDFCWIHFFGNESWIIYAHHVVSILIIINVFLKNYGGGGVSYGVAGLEFTNPYLQLRWFLRTHGHLNKPIHTITELWFILLFFIIRIVGGTVLLYYSLVHSCTDLTTKASFLSIYGISWVLQWQIFVFFRKKYLVAANLRNTNFINSKVSISPYFQRRTLDNNIWPEEQNVDNDAERVVNSSPRIVVASSSVIQTNSPLEESPESVSSEMKSPKWEKSKVSIEDKENSEGNSDADNENESRRGSVDQNETVDD